jgi:hypothetical protein
LNAFLLWWPVDVDRVASEGNMSGRSELDRGSKYPSHFRDIKSCGARNGPSGTHAVDDSMQLSNFVSVGVLLVQAQAE